MDPLWLRWMEDGPRVFGAAVGALALIGAWLTPPLLALVRGASRRRRLSSLGRGRDDVPAGDGIVVTLRGRLVSTEASDGVVVTSDVPAMASDWAEQSPATAVVGALVLETRSGLVRIPDDAIVVVGSEEARPSGVRGGSAVVQRRASLRAGEAVLAAGVVGPAMGPSATTGYRGGAPTWAMSAGPDGRVRLAALGPRAGATTRAARALGAALAATIGALSLATAAHVTLVRARNGRGTVVGAITRSWCSRAGVTSAIAASASPFERREALDEVALGLRCARDRRANDRVTFDLALRLRGAPPLERAVGMLAMGDPGAAADILMTCADAESKVRAGWIRAGLGDFARASEALDAGTAALRTPSELHRAVIAHAIAGRWERASTTARRAAELAAARRGVRESERYALTMACVADVAAARAGDVEALPRMRRRAEEDGAMACRFLGAEIAWARGGQVDEWTLPRERQGVDVPFDEYGRSPIGGSLLSDHASDDIRALWWCLEPTGRCGSFSQDTWAATGLPVYSALTLRPFAAQLLRRYRSMPTLPDEHQWDAMQLAMSRALFESAAGEHVAARATVQWALDHSGSTHHYRPWALTVQAWIAAATGDRAAVERAILGGARVEAEVAVRRWVAGDRAGIAAAVENAHLDREQGSALVAGRADLFMSWLRARGGVVDTAAHEGVLAGVGYGVLDRAAVRDWLRTEDVWMNPDSLLWTWRTAAVRLSIATRVDDRETAEAMRVVVSRHCAAVDRSEIAITLSVLGAYYPSYHF